MNKEYARLVNGTPEYAPATLRGATGLIVNPSRMTYLAHGWKFLDLQTPADPPSGMEYALTGYAETATDIRAEWKLVAIAAPPRFLPPAPASPSPNPKSPPSPRKPPTIDLGKEAYR